MNNDIMRAKEYLRINQRAMYYFDETNRVIRDLYDIRNDKEMTQDYFERILQSDIRYAEKMKENEVYKEYGQPMLEFEDSKVDYYDATFRYNEYEVDKSRVEHVREELKKVIRDDKSFGYLFHLLSKQDNFPTQHEIVEAILEEGILEKLHFAEKRIVELEEKLEEYRKNIELYSEQPNEINTSKKIRNHRTMEVTTNLLLEMLKNINVNKTSIDATKISDFISYITNYSNETIRQYMSKHSNELTIRQAEEIKKINQLLKDINANISI